MVVVVVEVVVVVSHTLLLVVVMEEGVVVVVVVQNGAMTSQWTEDAPWLCLCVSRSPVFCHWSSAGSYLNTSDNVSD